MAGETGIQWTDSTWNAWWGCQRVGPGCDNCYAEALDKRTGGAHWGAKADRRRTSETNWNEPLRWQKKADAFEAKHGHRRRVFCGSMMDIMDNAVPLDWSHEAFARIEACDRLDWQLLTKRIGNVTGRVPEHWLDGKWPRHVGLMITVVTQDEVDRDVKKLLKLKADYGIPWVGLSVEPLIEAVTLPDAALDSPVVAERVFRAPLDWVIVGGESGHGARPFDTAWAEHLAIQCALAGVPCFVKQLGAKVLKDGAICPKGAKKGDDMTEWPEEIRIREMPRLLATVRAQ